MKHRMGGGGQRITNHSWIILGSLLNWPQLLNDSFYGEFSKKKPDKSIVKKNITLGPPLNWLHVLQDSLLLTLLKAMIKRMTKRTVGNISGPPSSWGDAD